MMVILLSQPPEHWDYKHVPQAWLYKMVLKCRKRLFRHRTDLTIWDLVPASRFSPSRWEMFPLRLCVFSPSSATVLSGRLEQGLLLCLLGFWPGENKQNLHRFFPVAVKVMPALCRQRLIDRPTRPFLWVGSLWAIAS